jgi:hypothetical protein
MPSIAYCSQCGEYVQLSAEGTCPFGHQRSALRDVREGGLGSAPATASTSKRIPTPPDVEEHSELLAQIIGKSVVLVPLALILGWGLWTGYEQFPGMSVGMRLLASAGSLLFTVGLAFLFVRKRR